MDFWFAMVFFNSRIPPRKHPCLSNRSLGVWHSFDNGILGSYNGLKGTTGSWRMMFLQEGFEVGRAAIHRNIVCTGVRCLIKDWHWAND